jgi:virginiamycin B lyase
MLKRGICRALLSTIAAMVFFILQTAAHAQTPAALSGRVSSQEEGTMEGVVVRAKKAGSTMTVSVVSDAQGRYSFPLNRLDAGQYALSIRAAGYMLEGPASVTIGAQKNAAADLKLRKATTDETASQLNDAEWLMSMPGTDAQKAAFRNCNHCHTFERIARTKYDAGAALATIERMARYSPSSFPYLIQPHPTRRIGGGPPTPESRERAAATRRGLAEYIASINLSKSDTWGFELKTLPRPKGKATKVIFTEYDLPARTRQPHDVVMDS